MKFWFVLFIGLLIAVPVHARTLRVGTQSVPLTTDKQSTPALAVRVGNVTHYGFLVSGTAPGRLTVRMPAGQIHSLTPPPPTGYVTNGLIVHLDAMWNTVNGRNPSAAIWSDLSGNGNNFTLVGSPAFGPREIIFDTASRFAQSVNNVQLVGYDAITVEARFRPARPSEVFFLFEHSSNFNLLANRGAIGLVANHDGMIEIPNEFHTVHNVINSAVGARNFVAEINDGLSHTSTNTFSAVPNPTGRLSYHNGVLSTFIPSRDFSTSTATDTGRFINSTFFISRRQEQLLGAGNTVLQSFRIYNRQLSAAEICQNAWADYNRFGGAVPGC